MINSSNNINISENIPSQAVDSGSLGYVVGPTLESAGPEWAGAVDTIDTTIIPGSICSITIIAKGVTDGLENNTPDQIIVEYSDGTIQTMLNDTAETFSIIRNSDSELSREFIITATGNAYAKIIYTNTP